MHITAMAFHQGELVVADERSPARGLASDGNRLFGVDGQAVFVRDGAHADLGHPVHSIAVTAKNVWVAGDTHLFRLTPDLAVEWAVELPGGVTTDFDASERRVVVVKDRRTVHLFDGRNGAALANWRRGGDDVQNLSVRFGAKPDQLYQTVNRGSQLKLVSAKSGRAVGANSWGHPMPSPWAGPMVRHGDLIAILQNGTDVLVWDRSTDAAVFFASGGNPVVAMALSKTQIALGDRDGGVVIHDLRHPPGCVGWTRWPGRFAHGTRDGETWIVRNGILARLDFADPDRLEGIALEDFPELDATAELIFHDDLVVLPAYREVAAWDAATGRRAWRTETPGLRGGIHRTAETQPFRDRFPLWRVDLPTGALVELGEVVVGDVGPGPVNWASLRAVGPHLIAVIEGSPKRAFLVEDLRMGRAVRPSLAQRRHHDGRIFDDGEIVDLATGECRPVPARIRWHRELDDGRLVGWDHQAHRVTIAGTDGSLVGHAGHGSHVHTFLFSAGLILTVDMGGYVRTWRS
ncbi:hypothetical protein [Herbidospora sp. RD11066]